MMVSTSSDVVADDGLCSLREAITSANTNAASGASAGECPAGSSSTPDVIALGATTYALAIPGASEDANQTGDFDVEDSVVIRGAGANATAIDGSSLDRVFDIVRSPAQVTIEALTIRNGDAGSQSNGGGVRNVGVLSVVRSTIAGNHATNGGGIYNIDFASVVDSTLADNAALSGGALLNLGTVSVTRTTFSGNDASFGGAIQSDGLLRLTNSTVTGNSADQGGAIRAFQWLIMSQSTVAGNTASVIGGIDNSRVTNGTVGGSIVANNSGGNCASAVGDGGSNLTFPVSDDSCGGTWLVGDPRLGPLADNGGLTETRALTTGSEAVDRIPASDSACTTTDQRGVDRPVGPGCDVGAYELEYVDGYANPAVAITAKTLVASRHTFASKIRVTNHGPALATGVVVTDPLPAGTRLVSVRADRGTCSASTAGSTGTVSCSLGTLAKRAVVRITVTVTVDAPPGSVLSDTATVSSASADSQTANNSATAVTLVR